VFCTSKVDADLDFALRSIEMNTLHPNFEVLVGADPGLEGVDPRPALDAHRARYPWFDYVYYTDRPRERLGMGSASDMLEDLYQRLLERGCERFFCINDDVSVTQYWLHYMEDAMRRLGGQGVVIPHDGIASAGPEAGYCGFYCFSREYVEEFHPHGTAFRAEPVQCYWVDTEFCVRAKRRGRLLREPRCCVLHVHHEFLPSMLKGTKRLRATNSSYERDAEVFLDFLRRERIDPWKHIPNFKISVPGRLLPAFRELAGVEEREPAAAPAGVSA